MKNKVFILNGSAESGKNELSKILSKKLKNSSIFHYSQVDKVKEFLSWYGVTEKTDKSRQLMSDITDLLVNYDNLTLKDLAKSIKNNVNSYNQEGFTNLYFVDVREIQSIEKLKVYLSSFLDENDILTIVMTRPRHKASTCTKDNLEMILNYEYDYNAVCENIQDIEDFSDLLINLEDL